MMNSALTAVYAAAWAVDKGLRRDHNEDSVAAVDFELVHRDMTHAIGLYAIADGMGGREHGEIASRLAVQTVVQQLMNDLLNPMDELPIDCTAWVASSVHVANHVVCDAGMNMATTLVVAMIVDNQVHIGNVGDSRAYRISEDEVVQITEDQSMVQGLVNTGVLTDIQAQHHPYRNILDQAIGLRETVKVDTYSVVFPAGSYLLLCSDGLTNELSNDTIHHLIWQSTSPQDACDELIRAANASGGQDNISVVLVQMH
jgi:PPM family protein phosphatase